MGVRERRGQGGRRKGGKRSGLVDLHEGSKFGAHLSRGSFGPRAFMMRHQGDIFYLRVEHKDGGAWRVFERRLRKKVRATGPYTR